MSEKPPVPPQYLVELVAGFIAGVSTTCVAHPLDVVKTRLQLQVDQKVTLAPGNSFHLAARIIRNEGMVKGLYRGLTPNLVGNSASWALYFASYDQLKRKWSTGRAPENRLSHLDYFTASGAAGVLTALCTNPIWVIKTRMLSTSAGHPGAYTSISDGIRQIIRNEGLGGFYRGIVPSLFGVTQGALQFMAYEWLKIQRSRGPTPVQRQLHTLDYLATSGLAKIFAGSAIYPYQVVRARLQTYDANQTYKNTRDAIAQIWAIEGLRGFYKGLGPNLLRVLPSTWVTFLVYEKSRVFLPMLYEKIALSGPN